MKKLILLALLAVVLSLVACSSGSNSPVAGQPAPRTDTPLIGWMIDGTFSIDYRVSVADGQGGFIESEGSLAVDGANYAALMTTLREGEPFSIGVITVDGWSYIFDNVEKQIFRVEVTEDDDYVGILTDYTDIKLTGTGTGEVDGKTLNYEEYSDAASGKSVRYYLEGGEVYAIETGDGSNMYLMIITDQSQSVAADAFDLPTGYTETW
jgi:hypothetical protein